MGIAVLALCAVALTNATPAHAGSVTSIVSGNFYYLSYRGPYSAKPFCLDVLNAGTANDSRLQMFSCGPQWNQQFQAVHVGMVGGHDAWRLKPRYAPSMCVAVLGASGSNGAPAVIHSCNNGWEQLWDLGRIVNVWYVEPIYEVDCLQGLTYAVSNYVKVIVGTCTASYPYFLSLQWTISNSMPT